MNNKIEDNKQFTNSKNIPNNIAAINYYNTYPLSQQLDIGRENHFQK